MKFTLKTTIKASANQIYSAWLDSKEHTNMTGGEAIVSNKVDGEFTAWDGYIGGKNISLNSNKRIKQSWRTSEFEDSDEDSTIEIILDEVSNGTEITLIHTNLNETGEQYKNGWEEHYFQPMKEYFNNK